MKIVTDQLMPTSPLIPLELDKVEYIILHHAEAQFASWTSINLWHKQNGWSCFGYNEYIRKDGEVIIGRGDNIGAQCAGMNSRSYGICCEGNYEIETEMPAAQKSALIERIRVNRPRFKNFMSVEPHSKFYPTACPGVHFPLAEIIQKSEVIDLNLDQAIKVLVDEGIINSPEFRKKVCEVVQWESEFVIKIAEKILELKSQK
jgi:hypothetical protein